MKQGKRDDRSAHIYRGVIRKENRKSWVHTYVTNAREREDRTPLRLNEIPETVEREFSVLRTNTHIYIYTHSTAWVRTVHTVQKHIHTSTLNNNYTVAFSDVRIV